MAEWNVFHVANLFSPLFRKKKNSGFSRVLIFFFFFLLLQLQWAAKRDPQVAPVSVSVPTAIPRRRGRGTRGWWRWTLRGAGPYQPTSRCGCWQQGGGHQQQSIQLRLQCLRGKWDLHFHHLERKLVEWALQIHQEVHLSGWADCRRGACVSGVFQGTQPSNHQRGVPEVVACPRRMKEEATVRKGYSEKGWKQQRLRGKEQSVRGKGKVYVNSSHRFFLFPSPIYGECSLNSIEKWSYLNPVRVISSH